MWAAATESIIANKECANHDSAYKYRFIYVYIRISEWSHWALDQCITICGKSELKKNSEGVDLRIPVYPYSNVPHAIPSFSRCQNLS